MGEKQTFVTDKFVEFDVSERKMLEEIAEAQVLRSMEKMYEQPDMTSFDKFISVVEIYIKLRDANKDADKDGKPWEAMYYHTEYEPDESESNDKNGNAPCDRGVIGHNDYVALKESSENIVATHEDLDIIEFYNILDGIVKDLKKVTKTNEGNPEHIGIKWLEKLLGHYWRPL